MPTHAEVAAGLLRDAAGFFMATSEQNEAQSDQLQQSARTFRLIADLVENDPTGEMQE